MGQQRRSIESIVSAALEKNSPHERATYLNEACGGDRELREQVEVLLREHTEAPDSFPESPGMAETNVAGVAETHEPGPPETEARFAETQAGGWPATEAAGSAATHAAMDLAKTEADGATPDAAGIEQPGAEIGPYKLLMKLGEGGFGIVYLAEQKEPIKRNVALKILKAGMDTGQVLARFEAERLEHSARWQPNQNPPARGCCGSKADHSSQEPHLIGRDSLAGPISR